MKERIVVTNFLQFHCASIHIFRGSITLTLAGTYLGAHIFLQASLLKKRIMYHTFSYSSACSSIFPLALPNPLISEKHQYGTHSAEHYLLPT